MTTTTDTIADAVLAAWNERDAERRAELAEDGRVRRISGFFGEPSRPAPSAAACRRSRRSPRR